MGQTLLIKYNVLYKRDNVYLRILTSIESQLTFKIITTKSFKAKTVFDLKMISQA